MVLGMDMPTDATGNSMCFSCMGGGHLPFALVQPKSTVKREGAELETKVIVIATPFLGEMALPSGSWRLPLTAYSLPWAPSANCSKA
jgi:hypothetical protein